MSGLTDHFPDGIDFEHRKQMAHVLREAGAIRDTGDLFVDLHGVATEFYVNNHNRQIGKGGRWPKEIEAWKNEIESLKHVESIYKEAAEKPWLFYKDLDVVLASLADTIHFFEERVKDLQTLPNAKERADIKQAVRGLVEIFAEFTGVTMDQIGPGARHYPNHACRFVAVGLDGLGERRSDDRVFELVSEVLKGRK